ncbi:hypothetical protein [Sphingobium sp.]|uniref:hypothetical protein n=1 Tax=Sphingobium sp. TaxID=1912891 RepID=UPI0035C7164B
MNSAANDWEAAPWDASDEIADAQLKGYRERSDKPIHWQAVGTIPPNGKLFGLNKQWHISRDVEYFAEHEGEQLLLIQLAWHGFPDPPEWGLVSRVVGSEAAPWSEWGYFVNLPACWSLPQDEG